MIAFNFCRCSAANCGAPMIVLKGHKAGKSVLSLAFSPDGRLLASSGYDGSVRLWKLSDATSQVLHDQPLWGHALCNVAFSSDGETLAWCDQVGIQLWRRDTGAGRTLPWGEQLYPAQLTFASNDRLLVLAAHYPRKWDMRTGAKSHAWEGYPQGCDCIAASPNGKVIATGHMLRNLRGDRNVHEFQLHDAESGAFLGILERHTQQATAVTISPDNRWVAAACSQYLIAWDYATRKIVLRQKLASQHYKSVAFTCDGRFLLASHNLKTVQFWDTRTWTERRVFDWGIGPVVCLAIAPDGMRAAAGSKRGKIVVWDLEL